MTDSILAGADIIVDGARRSGLAVRLRGTDIVSVEPDAPAASGRIALPADCLLAPGLIDIQVNGGGGVQFDGLSTCDDVLAMAAAHRRLGTTTIIPTLITDTPAASRSAGRAAQEACRTPSGGVAGMHFEGPFLSQARPGVHRPELIHPPDDDDIAWLEELRHFDGRLVMTVAPEAVPDTWLDWLGAAGFRLLAGHSAATLARVHAAASHGLAGFTHIFNAMAPPAAREPGVVGAALTLDDMFCSVIADLIHVDPAMLSLLLRCKRPDRIMLVSDSMAPAGTDLTAFTLQGRRIDRMHGRLMTADGTLAGADLSLAQAVRNMAAQHGVGVAQAVAMASTVPAAFLGLPHIGDIAPGKRADFVLLDPELQVLGTWVAGIFQAAS